MDEKQLQALANELVRIFMNGDRLITAFFKVVVA